MSFPNVFDIQNRLLPTTACVDLEQQLDVENNVCYIFWGFQQLSYASIYIFILMYIFILTELR